MSALQYKTRGNESPRGLPKVYFCCHPADLDRYFADVANDILKAQRCAVWYANADTPRDADFLSALQEMDLFVVPITAELLYTPNHAMSAELPFAVKHKKSILPLLQDQSLISDFNHNDLFRNRQYLNKFDQDATALPYTEKLKNYLQDILIGDELADEIRSAFDAYVFLSYRKKDRKYAQELMQLIHENDFCRDVAIWYDEFLTPGEDFNESIAAALEKSDLFVMAVTPNVLEYVPNQNGELEKNYVVREECYAADKARLPILPAEMVATDSNLLAEMFEKELACTNAHDTQALRDALRDKLKSDKLRKNDADPYHNYLIGLAYLVGLDMEKNSRTALSMIRSSSDAGLMEATEKMVSIHRNGVGVDADVNTTLSRQRLLIRQREKTYHAQPSETTLNDWFWAAIQYGDLLAELEQYAAARDQFSKASDISRKADEIDLYLRFLHYQSVVDERMGDAWRATGNYHEAEKNYANCLLLRRQILDLEDSTYQRQCVCLAYERLGDICSRREKYNEAVGHYKNKLEMDREFCAAGGSSDDLLSLFNALYKLSKAHLNSCLYRQEDPADGIAQALCYGEEALRLADSFVSDNDNVLARYRQSGIYTLMGKILFNDAELRKTTGAKPEEYMPLYEKAEPMQQQGLMLAQKMYDSCGHTLQSTQCLIAAYRALGDLYRARTSEVLSVDYNRGDGPDADMQILLDVDRKLLDIARAYYNKALDHAQTIHRNFGIPSTAQELFQCRMDMASSLAHYSRLPNDPKTYKYLRKLALGHYEEALKLAQWLSNKQPSTSHREQVARVYTHMAILGPQEMKKYLPESIAIYERLSMEHPQDDSFSQRLAGLKAMLAGKPAIFQIY